VLQGELAHLSTRGKQVVLPNSGHTVQLNARTRCSPPSRKSGH
jgi:hypothetical protein